MLGSSAVGKSSLVSQFMTSEYLHAYDTSIGTFYGLAPARVPKLRLYITTVVAKFKQISHHDEWKSQLLTGREGCWCCITIVCCRLSK